MKSNKQIVRYIDQRILRLMDWCKDFDKRGYKAHSNRHLHRHHELQELRIWITGEK